LSTFKKGQKKAKWPNGQTISFLANSFKKGQIRQIWPLKRSNGNPVRERECMGKKKSCCTYQDVGKKKAFVGERICEKKKAAKKFLLDVSSNSFSFLSTFIFG